MKKIIIVCILSIAVSMFSGCGGAGAQGAFAYNEKYSGWVGGPYTYMTIDAVGNIVPESYVGQRSRCPIEGSLRKTGNTLTISVQMTMPDGNDCTDVVLTASGQLTFDSETKWWTGTGTGIFSNNPNTTVSVGFTIAKGWD